MRTNEELMEALNEIRFRTIQQFESICKQIMTDECDLKTAAIICLVFDKAEEDWWAINTQVYTENKQEIDKLLDEAK